MNRKERRKQEKRDNKLTKVMGKQMDKEQAKEFTKEMNEKLQQQLIEKRSNEVLVEISQHWMGAMLDNRLSKEKVDKILDDYNKSVMDKHDKKFKKIKRVQQKYVGMKDYLNAEETNEFLMCKYMAAVVYPRILNNWGERGGLLPDEKKALKYVNTYLNKFIEAVEIRLDQKELDVFDRKMADFNFQIIDNYTKKKLMGQWEKELGKVKLQREEFEDFCEQIMDTKCKNCTTEYIECPLHDLFRQNFVAESECGAKNCRYAYGDKIEERIKKKAANKAKKKAKRKQKTNRKGEM